MPFARRLLTLPLLLVLGACGVTGTTGGAVVAGPADGPVDGARLSVVTSVYPLRWVTEQVAGDRAEIATLTSAGADPHEVELSPRAVGSLSEADLVVYSAGLQLAVDDAVAGQTSPATALDVSAAADLVVLGESEEEHAGHDADHDHGGEDPHFWLDPERYGHVAEAIADRLAEVDPAGGHAYRDNAERVVALLTALDEEFAAGLATCASRDLVTSHEAFGYLAARYDLHQIGITGIDPESEPSPARLAAVSAQVEQLGVEVVYAEPILSDAIARTVARETGTQVLTLDPLEGLTEASAGDDYPEVMRANLAALQEGLGCS